MRVCDTSDRRTIYVGPPYTACRVSNRMRRKRWLRSNPANAMRVAVRSELPWRVKAMLLLAMMVLMALIVAAALIAYSRGRPSVRAGGGRAIGGDRESQGGRKTGDHCARRQACITGAIGKSAEDRSRRGGAGASTVKASRKRERAAKGRPIIFRKPAADAGEYQRRRHSQLSPAASE